jgi:hypothetical protein
MIDQSNLEAAIAAAAVYVALVAVAQLLAERGGMKFRWPYHSSPWRWRWGGARLATESCLRADGGAALTAAVLVWRAALVSLSTHVRDPLRCGGQADRGARVLID